MGVKGLWQLLTPCARQVPIESLSNKTLAVDASIWLLQFIKAIRNPDGSVMRNAHLIGMFRRLCKLLYYRIKPVLVFDGKTPELKKKTTAIRRRKRERTEDQFRKAAEKLLMNRLRQGVLGNSSNNNAAVAVDAAQKNAEWIDDMIAAGFEEEEEDVDVNNDETSRGHMVISLTENFDEKAFKALPLRQQYDSIVAYADANKEAKYEKPSGNMEDFSNMQLQSYLKNAILNQELRRIQSEQERAKVNNINSNDNNDNDIEVDDEEEARIQNEIRKNYELKRIASDPEREYFLEKQTTTTSTLSSLERAWSRNTDGSAINNNNNDISLQKRLSTTSSLFSQLTDDSLKKLDSLNTVGNEDGEVRELLRLNTEDPPEAVYPVEDDTSKLLLTLASGQNRKDDDDNDEELQKAIAMSLNSVPTTVDVGNSLQPLNLPIRVEDNEDNDEEFRQALLLSMQAMPINANNNVNINNNNTTMEEESVWKDIDVGDRMRSTPSPVVSPGKRPKVLFRPEIIRGDIGKKISNLPACYADDDDDDDDDDDMGADKNNKNIQQNNNDNDNNSNNNNINHQKKKKRKEKDTRTNDDNINNKNKSGVDNVNNNNNNGLKGNEMDTAEDSDNAEHRQQQIDKDQEYARKLQEQVWAEESSTAAAATTLNQWLDASRDQVNSPRSVTALADSPISRDVETMNIPMMSDYPVQFFDENDNGLVANNATTITTTTSNNNNNENNINKNNNAASASASAAPPMSEDQVQALREQLITEEAQLRSKTRELRKAGGEGDMISDEMLDEVRELLKLLGIPYIIAPEEAEAQCAVLEEMKLVDGILSDDSDTFLFGGQMVYRHVFDSRGSNVELHSMKHIKNDLGLERIDLIHMALMLGSDYTSGVPGIGIVNAIEIIRAFKGERGLEEFKEFMFVSDANMEGYVAEADSLIAEFAVKHRNVRRHWQISPSFPSEAVILGYTNPVVDASDERFQHGTIDVEPLKEFCAQKFGWTHAYTENYLSGVLSSFASKQQQLTMDAFVTILDRNDEGDGPRVSKIRSSRMQSAVAAMTRNKDNVGAMFVRDGDDDNSANKSNNSQKRKKKMPAFRPAEPVKETTAQQKRKKTTTTTKITTTKAKSKRTTKKIRISSSSSSNSSVSEENKNGSDSY